MSLGCCFGATWYTHLGRLGNDTNQRHRWKKGPHWRHRRIRWPRVCCPPVIRSFLSANAKSEGLPRQSAYHGPQWPCHANAEKGMARGSRSSFLPVLASGCALLEAVLIFFVADDDTDPEVSCSHSQWGLYLLLFLLRFCYLLVSNIAIIRLFPLLLANTPYSCVHCR